MEVSRTHGTNATEANDKGTEAQQATTIWPTTAVWWPAAILRHGTVTVQ